MDSEGVPAMATPPTLTAPGLSNVADTVQPSPSPQPTVIQSAGDCYPDLRRRSYELLENIKVRFGDNSPVSAAIHAVLGQFAAGNISKRDTYFAIFDRLAGHEDLIHDLAALLNHEDARWSPRDFEREQAVSFPHISPEYLQPQHQPSIPVPRLPSFIANSPDSHPTIDPELPPNPFVWTQSATEGFSGPPLQHAPESLGRNYDYGIYGPGYQSETQNSLSPRTFAHAPHSLVTESQPRVSNFSQPAPPATVPAQTPIFPSHTGFGQVSAPISPSTGLDAPPHPHRSNSDNEGSNNAQYGISNMHSPYRHESRLQLSPPDQNHHAGTASVPSTTPSGKPLLGMEPPIARSQSVLSPSEKNGTEAHVQLDVPLAANPSSKPSLVIPAKKPLANTGSLRSKGHFVHSLCGKAFNTRSGVKKHHWGARLNDLKTVTGCWAKHGKPDAAWDDHPSCKEQPKDERHANDEPVRQCFKAPVAQMMPARQSSIVDMQNLNELPPKVAQSLSISPSTAVPGDQARYSSDQISPSNSYNFQTLLTVVNAASSIESPTPQSRNDSVITHLDAQVNAQELQALQDPLLMDHARKQISGLQRSGYLAIGSLAQNQHPSADAGQDWRPSLLGYASNVLANPAVPSGAHLLAQSPSTSQLRPNQTQKRSRDSDLLGTEPGGVRSSTSPDSGRKRQKDGNTDLPDIS